MICGNEDCMVVSGANVKESRFGRTLNWRDSTVPEIEEYSQINLLF